VDRQSLGQLVGRTGHRPHEVLLAAYCVLLLRVAGRESIQLVVTLSDDEGAPRAATALRLQPRWSDPFAVFLRDCAGELAEAARHGPFALHVLNAQRACAGVTQPLTFDAGFRYRAEGHRPWGSAGALPPEAPPEVQRAVRLCLLVDGRGPGLAPSVSLEYDRAFFSPQRALQLAGYLADFVRAAAAGPDRSLGEVPLGPEEYGGGEAAQADADARFAFEQVPAGPDLPR
jgi:hypothetical protein